MADNHLYPLTDPPPTGTILDHRGTFAVSSTAEIAEKPYVTARRVSHLEEQVKQLQVVCNIIPEIADNTLIHGEQINAHDAEIDRTTSTVTDLKNRLKRLQPIGPVPTCQVGPIGQVGTEQTGIAIIIILQMVTIGAIFYTRW